MSVLYPLNKRVGLVPCPLPHMYAILGPFGAAIIGQHGGTIRAEFPPDGGMRMVVTRPRALDPAGGGVEAGHR
jgi:hypothetical protein